MHKNQASLLYTPCYYYSAQHHISPVVAIYAPDPSPYNILTFQKSHQPPLNRLPYTHGIAPLLQRLTRRLAPIVSPKRESLVGHKIAVAISAWISISKLPKRNDGKHESRDKEEEGRKEGRKERKTYGISSPGNSNGHFPPSLDLIAQPCSCAAAASGARIRGQRDDACHQES